MMQDVLFVLKCLVVTIALVVCFQIRIGGRTIEGHMMSWVHHSSISHTLQDVAEGAVKVANKGKEAVSGWMGSREPNDEPATSTQASSGSWFKIKRSAAYYRQKEREDQKKREASRAARDSSNDDGATDDPDTSSDRD